MQADPVDGRVLVDDGEGFEGGHGVIVRRSGILRATPQAAGYDAVILPALIPPGGIMIVSRIGLGILSLAGLAVVGAVRSADPVPAGQFATLQSLIKPSAGE